MYQPGGVGVFCINRATHWIQTSGSDLSGLGQFCWMVLKGCNNKLLHIVATYRPSKSNNGHLSVSQQHWRHFANQNLDQISQQHPWQQFWSDLKLLLQMWMEVGKQVVVGIDVNKYVGHPDIKYLLWQVWHDRSNNQSTQSCGSPYTPAGVPSNQRTICHPQFTRPLMQLPWGIRRSHRQSLGTMARPTRTMALRGLHATHH